MSEGDVSLSLLLLLRLNHVIKLTESDKSVMVTKQIKKNYDHISIYLLQLTTKPENRSYIHLHTHI